MNFPPKLNYQMTFEEILNNTFACGLIFVQLKNKDSLEHFMSYSKVLVAIIRAYKDFKDAPTDFDIDISTELLILFLSGLIPNKDNFKLKIKVLIDRRRTTDKQFKLSSDIEELASWTDDQIFSGVEIRNSLEIREVLNSNLKDCSTYQRVQILYYLRNPLEIKLLVNNGPEVVDKYIIFLKFVSIRKIIIKNSSTSNFIDITIPKTRTTNALMMSGLYKESPQLFVLLTMLGDFRKFLEFISLFEGSTVKIPSLAKIAKIFEESTNLSKKFDRGELNADDKNRLAMMCLEIPKDDFSSNPSLNPFLEDYLKSIVTKTMEKYDIYLSKIINTASNSTDPIAQMRVLNLLTSEIKSQSGLLREIMTTSGTINNVNKAIETISGTNLNVHESLEESKLTIRPSNSFKPKETITEPVADVEAPPEPSFVLQRKVIKSRPSDNKSHSCPDLFDDEE